MKKFSKKALALLLSVLMLCSMIAALPFTATAAPTNLSLKATATTDDFEVCAQGGTAESVNDGDMDTRWATNNGGASHPARWIQLSFDEKQTVKSFRAYWQHPNVKAYDLQVSDTGEANGSWDTVYSYSGNGAEVDTINLDRAVTSQYFRLYITDYSPATGEWYNVSIWEWELYAEEIDIPEVSLGTLATSLQMPTITAEDKTFRMPEVPEGFDIKINGADYEQIIASDGTIRHPLNDTNVKISFVISNDEESLTTADYIVTVPGVAEGEVPAEANSKPAVIPELAEWQGGEGDYTLPKAPTLIIDEESYKKLSEKEQTNLDGSAIVTKDDFLDITGNTVTVEYGSAADAKAGDIVVTFVPVGSTQLGDEGYKMEITDKIEITTETQTGFFWATRSILQILKQNGTTIPQGITYDYPRFEVRSFMLDVGRTPISLESVYDYMRNLAWYKMNDFMIHFNDNLIFFEDRVPAGERNGTDFSKAFEAYAAFRLESEVENNGVKLTAEDRHYTKEEFRDFIQISRWYGVNIVPEFDLPAHSLSIVKVYPEYGLQVWGGGHATYLDHLDLSNPDVTEFAKSLWKEYTEGDNPVFDEDTDLNIGADEYTYNAEDYRKFTDTMLGFVQDELHRNVRVWGSLSTITGKTPVRSKDVTMLIWNTGWANPKNMYNAGYDLINITDGGNYIVPGADYYADYIDPQGKYNSYDPSNIGGTLIPSGDAKMRGGAYAIWNDMIDTREVGMTDYDIFDRFFKPLVGYSSNLWGDADDLTYAQAAEVYAVTSTAPNSNPYYEVKSKSDTKVQYDFDAETIKDKSGNDYDIEEVKNAEVVNEQGKNALKLNGGESYVTTPIDFFGAGSELSFSVYREDDSTDEQILFETSDKFETWAIKAVQKETGKVGFSREKVDFSFNYELPVGEWVDLKIVGHKDTADLYVNGELVDTVGSAGRGRNYMHATLTIPFSRIGSETNAFKGLIADLSVYQEAPFSADDPTIIDRSNFSISSENFFNGTTEGPARFAIDGDTSTIWHSNYSPYQSLPADLTIDMKEVYTINKFTYIPRQSGTNGIITSYTISYKLNADDEWTEIAAGTLSGDANIKQIPFEAVEARYVKFVALDGLTNSANGAFASAAEVYVHKVLEEDDYIIADVDGSGKIDASDATYALQIAAGLLNEETSDLNFAAADVDGSGKVDATDATYILQFAAGLLEEFPKA